MDEFNQQKIEVDKQNSIDKMGGDIGRAGDFVNGDKITIGDITGSTSVAVGAGAQATVYELKAARPGNSQPPAAHSKHQRHLDSGRPRPGAAQIGMDRARP